MAISNDMSASVRRTVWARSSVDAFRPMHSSRHSVKVGLGQVGRARGYSYTLQPRARIDDSIELFVSHNSRASDETATSLSMTRLVCRLCPGEQRTSASLEAWMTATNQSSTLATGHSMCWRAPKIQRAGTSSACMHSPWLPAAKIRRPGRDSGQHERQRKRKQRRKQATLWTIVAAELESVRDYSLNWVL
jgi:hypothetical protein